MAQILLFHHAQGLTDGVLAFADDLRAAGHRPDLAAAGAMPPALVYAGFSLGVLPAQSLAQQRAGARGALLYHSAVPLGHFGDRWPEGVPLQVHLAVEDPWEDLAEVEAFTAFLARVG